MQYRLKKEEQELLKTEFAYQEEESCLFGTYYEEGLPIYYANDEMAALLGYDSLDELVACTDGKVMNTVYPDDIPQVRKDFGEEVYEGKPVKSTHRVLRKDGSYFWAVYRGKMVRTDDGRLAIICLCSDMSSFIEQKNELERQRVIGNTLIKNLPGGYHRCSMEEGYPLMYMSNRFLDILGWTEAEVLSEFDNKFLNMVHPEDRELTHHYAGRVQDGANGQKYHEEIYRLRGKGGYRWVADTTMQMELDGRRFYQGFISDITFFMEEREKKEKQLERLRKKQLTELESQLDAERQYLSVLSRKYILVYHVDLLEDHAEVLKLDKHSNVWKMPGMRPGVSFEYRAHIKAFAEQFVLDSKQKFLQMLSPAYIADRLQHTTRYTFRYESVPNAVENHHYEIQVVRVNSDRFDGKVLIVSEEIDDVIHAEEKHQAELDAERQYLDILCWDYTAVYRVNLKNNTGIPLKVESDTFVAQQPQFRLRQEYPFVQYMKMYCDKFVAPTDRSRFQRALAPDNLWQELRTSQRFTFRYESISTPGGYVHFEAQAIRMSDDLDAGDILLGFRHIDDVVAVEQRHQQQLNAERQYLDLLSRDYTSVYHVDLEQGLATALKLGERTNTELLHTKLRRTFSYAKVMSNYCEKYLLSSSQPGFMHFMSPENLRKALQTSDRCIFRYRCRPDPKWHEHFEVQAIRMNDDPTDGNILVAFRQIDAIVTAEQQHQLELEERLENERLQNEVLDALGRNYNAIFRIDLQNDSYTNISCCDEIGYYYREIPSAEGMLTDVCERIVDEKYREQMHRFFDLTTLAQRLKEREFVETECITKAGVWHRARLIAKRRDERGVVTHVLYVTQIINDEKQYEEHLIAKAEYANQANQSKSGFISQVAHDIRTPMNSIFGFLEVAEANLDDPDKVRYSIGKIRTAGEFLKNLVNDVLDISRMEDGKVTLQPQKASLSQMLEDVRAPIQIAADEKQQIFRMDVQTIIHDQIEADFLRIMQIYINVLSNAVKYTPNGGIITFTVSQEEIPNEQKVRIVAQIADSGMGMSAELMQNMFNKFERGMDTRINKISGYGLGLTIVKQLVDLMGGTIDVHSQLGEGTSFCIRLDVPYVQKAVIEAPQPKVDYGARCAGMHILVAEDNALNREVITELLDMHDIRCECAEDGAVCLERFRTASEGTFNAILMDMQMPVMNGIEATRQIRALPLPWAKTIPIIAMTANAMKDDVKRCLDAGMNQHLAKPVDMEQLLKTLAQTLK